MAARSKPAPTVSHAPASWRGQLAGFAQWLLVHHYSERTIENRHLVLGYFIAWAEERGLTRPQEVTRPILERYQRWLYLYRKEDGEPLSIRGQRGRLSALRAWLSRPTVQSTSATPRVAFFESLPDSLHGSWTVIRLFFCWSALRKNLLEARFSALARVQPAPFVDRSWASV